MPRVRYLFPLDITRLLGTHTPERMRLVAGWHDTLRDVLAVVLHDPQSARWSVMVYGRYAPERPYEALCEVHGLASVERAGQRAQALARLTTKSSLGN